ncbi:MAG: hypothetical protein SGCHY_001552 [Lobulomycetales sp.]
MEKTEIIKEEIAYKRYLQIVQRSVKHADGKTVEWDVLATPATYNRDGPAFVAVMPYHSEDQTVTLVREYCQGPDAFLYTVPAGMFDVRKHSSPQEAAEHEMSEEARLERGKWTPLLHKDSVGITDLKMSANRYVCWLVEDPIPCSGMERDAEEYMTVERMSFSRVKELIRQGLVLPTAVTVLFLGMDVLGLVQ